ncbi:hypothetical protein BDV35DRAFT_394538 [Aspergillus flavus]|uniref:Rhodopsin domain-containing protein n=1 Tax=Aspergillus flavus TaxID=5059 RepID=A0A5N6GR65_ASPFL|nr:hypothetical protein BDV35DRAFT_394538 [Aspergillus flavus]RAQ73565.1 hypothetical protein COH20_004820 [Aspergillus flavus]RAQ80631.1 hypothetical protein COH21_008139 [Aspergillus flavus]
MPSLNDEDQSSITVRPDDHVALIVIVALVGLVWSLFMLGIRIYLRLRLTPPFGVDDAVAIFGTIPFRKIIGLVQTSVTLHAAFQGVGKREDSLAPAHVENGLKSIYVAWVLYPIAVCSSKVSLALLIARLTIVRFELRASYVLAGVGIFWGVVSVIVAACQCKMPKPWDLGAHHCDSMFVRWAVIETGNMIIELLIPGLILKVIWNLQARLKAKLTVLMAFSLQLLVAIPTIFRLILLRQTTIDELRNDRTFTITDTVMVTEITMHFSLMAATFPCLRKFLQAFDSNMGATTHMTTDPDDPKNTGSNGSYGLRSLQRQSCAKGSSFEKWPRNSNRYNRKYQPHTVTTVSAGASDPRGSPEGGGRLQRQRTRNNDMESGSVESDDSQLAIIRRTQHWEVTVESRGN